MRKITHEYQFYEWFEKEFPDFMSDEGQRSLKNRADEIMGAIDEYFTPDYMNRSSNAQYLKDNITMIKVAYKKRNFEDLGNALEGFRSTCEWV